jgi:ABC-type multidrug transport system fused ATPase/permease subunit
VEQNRPPTGWPMTGNIKFENIVLRYQDYGVDVLKDITMNIKAKEKIGMLYLILLARNKHMTFLFCVKNLHSENF